MAHPAVSLSVIVPFYRGLESLARCLTGVRRAAGRLGRECEILVAADGASEDPEPLVEACGARLLRLDGPRGPAVSRNRAAAQATADILVFVDSDVVVHDDALCLLAQRFGQDPGVDAVFGCYDDCPADPGLVSRSKNLAHAFIHGQASHHAVTFWAGLGAVRADAFRRVGGFDERFVRPSVEDIDLGYRLTASGSRIVSDPTLRCTHLKRWTLAGSVLSDVLDRGVPWTQLILRGGHLRDDLNLARRYRVCVVSAFVAACALPLAWVTPWAFVVFAAMLGVIAMFERPYLVFVARAAGWSAVPGALGLRVVHHLASGVSFVVGAALFVVQATIGVSLPGALPLAAWHASDARSAPGQGSSERA
jgi:glycosyltransferase involved in cell wall biosynthesis